MNPVPVWLQIAQPIATTAGVLVALWVAVIREPRKAREDRKSRAAQAEAERERHDAQIAALTQAEDDRLAAQARRIVPAIFRGNVFSDILWNLRIDNYSTDAVSGIKIDIIIRDRAGNDVPHGYRLARKETLAEVMNSIVFPVFSQTIDMMSAKYAEFVENIKSEAITLTDDPQQIAALQAQFDQMKPTIAPYTEESLKARVTHAIQTQLSDEWATILAPGQFTAMAIETTSAEYTPHLKMRFEDASGYIWERTDTDAPKRIHEPAIAQENQNG